MKPIKVKLAQLHQATGIPGITGSETTWNDTKVRGLKMYLIPQGLRCEVKKDGSPYVAIIPLANVAIAVIDQPDPLSLE